MINNIIKEVQGKRFINNFAKSKQRFYFTLYENEIKKELFEKALKQYLLNKYGFNIMQQVLNNMDFNIFYEKLLLKLKDIHKKTYYIKD